MVRAGDNRNACGIVVGKSEGRRLLGRPTCRLEDNIKMYFFSEMGWDGLVWIARFRLGTGGGLL